MSRGELVRGGAILVGSQVVNHGLNLVRSVIIARTIDCENMGIAATLAITMTLLDMFTELGVGTLLIQTPDGDDPLLQRTAHGFGVMRGLCTGIILFVLAWPVSMLFAIPNARWAFQCLALVPVIRGFLHQDVTRLQRQMRFGPIATVDIVSQAVATAVAWPLAAWLMDYSAMLWVMILQTVAMTVGTHVIAERPFELGWQRDHIVRMARFGWPLVITNMILFGVMQGDRLIIGAKAIFPAYTKTDLAVYSVAYGLALVPMLLTTRTSSTLLLPQLARFQDSQERFTRGYVLMMDVLAVVAGMTAILFITAGGVLMEMIYGPKYAGAVSFIGWLGAMQGVRLLRLGTTCAALAKGDTRNSMYSNLGRSLGIVGALGAASMGASLAWIAVCGLCGEVVALGVSITVLAHRHRIEANRCVRPGLVVVIAVLIGVLVSWLSVPIGGPAVTICLWLVASALFLLVADVALSSLQREVAIGARMMRAWWTDAQEGEGPAVHQPPKV